MKAPLILDGGMSRELIRLGAPFRQPEWSALALLEAPQFVSQVHRGFLSAGADIITTNSYAIVPFHLGEERFWQDGRRLAALAGHLARQAADAEIARSGRRVLVAGSLPPIFGSYEPAKFDPQQVQKYLAVLVKALEPYVDVWLAETLSLIPEAQAALTETRSAASAQKPFWVAFTPDDSPGASKTSGTLRSGETVSEATRWAATAGAEALLFNCARPEYMDGALRMAKDTLAENTELHAPLIGVYANAFAPRSEGYAANETICPTDGDLTPDAYCASAQRWLSDGADIVGGCCGVGHEHIRQLAKAFQTPTT